MNRTEERKRATQLRAVDARELIRRSLPVVLPHLTLTHIDQLQRVLDVAVINADIENKGSALDQQAIKGKIVHSSQHLRNPTVVAQRDRVLAQKIALKPGENAVLIDHRKLLAPGALKPRSANPDEAAYLLIVAEVYVRRGVWLVLDSSAGAMTQQMNPNDPRKWRVRLLLGYHHGGLVKEIKADAGKLTREALLSVSNLGAGYYEWVSRGPTLTTLERAIEGASSQITRGRDEHFWWSAHRSEFTIVSKVSDIFGRAAWPSESVWDEPHQVLVKARELRNAGKLTESGKFALLAACQAGWRAAALHEYIEATTRGADRVVIILEVAKTCGQIADAVMILLAVGTGLIRLLSTEGAASRTAAEMWRPQPAGTYESARALETAKTGPPPTPRPTPPSTLPTAPIQPSAVTAKPSVEEYINNMFNSVDNLLTHPSRVITTDWQGLAHVLRDAILEVPEFARMSHEARKKFNWLVPNPTGAMHTYNVSQTFWRQLNRSAREIARELFTAMPPGTPRKDPKRGPYGL